MDGFKAAKSIETKVQSFIETKLYYKFKIKIRQLRQKRKDYAWNNVGVVRSPLVNDGTVRSVFSEYFRRVKAANYKTLSMLLSRLTPEELAYINSELNFYSKNVLSKLYFPNEWINYVDIHTLVGYPKTQDRIFSDDVKAWLVEGVQKVKITKEEVKKYIYDIMGQVVPSSRGFYNNLDDYITARYTWMGKGSAQDVKLEVDGIKQRNKIGLALSYDDKELIGILSEENMLDKGLRTFVKPDEKGVKGRYVLSAPTRLFIMQKYIIEWLLDSTPAKVRGLASFLSAEEKVLDIQNAMKDYFTVPIDFSQFDYNLQSVFWEAFNEYCIEVMPLEFRKYVYEFERLFGSIKVHDVDGNFVGYWNKGMPSGLYMTAFGDSLFNLVAQKFVEFKSNSKYKSLFAQGDDGVILVRKSDNVDLDELARYFGEVGFVVNKQKNWFTPDVCEFLKMIITPTKVYQYPARAFSSVAWAYPDFRENTPLSKMNTLATVWKEFQDRIGISNDLEMISDIHAAMLKKLGWSKEKVRLWVHTPSQLGGFGLMPLEYGSKFVWDFQVVRPRIKGNVFRRFPFSDIRFRDVKVTNSVYLQVLDTTRFKVQSMQQVFRTNQITFKQYIEYYRAQSGLKNDLGLNLLEKNKLSDVPFKMFGFSDIFVTSLFGRLQMKNTLQQIAIALDALQSVSVRSNIMKPQLWK